MKALGFVLACIAIAGAGAAPIPIPELQRSTPVEFAAEIYPVLKQSCLACHNATKAKANLNLESPALMEKGGDSGPAIVPGKGVESRLLVSAAHQDEDLVMPPPGNKANAVALTPEQLGLLRLWIDQGAKGAAVVESKGPLPWRSLPGAGPVQAVAISPDGRLAAAARANRVELYELSTGRTLAHLADPALAQREPWKGENVADCDSVMSVAFASDDLLATGGFRTVRLWRRMPRVLRRDFGALAEVATALAVSRDGRWAAVGDAKGAVWLWSLEAEKFEPTALKQYAAPVSALIFSPDGTALISAAEDKSVCVSEIANRAVVFEAQSPTVIYALTFSEDAKEIFAGCADGAVRVWAWPKEAPASLPLPAREFKLQEQPVHALAAGESGTYVWAAADGTLRVASASDGKEMRKFTPEHPLARRVTLLDRELQVAQGLITTRKTQLAAAAEKAKKEIETARQAAQTFEKAKAEARRKRDEAEASDAAKRASLDDKALQEASGKANAAAAKADAALRSARVNAELGARLAGDAAAAQAAGEAAVTGAEAALAEAQAALDAAKKLAAEPPALPLHLSVSPPGEAVLTDASGSLQRIAVENGVLLESPDRAGIAAVLPSGEMLSVGADKHVRLTSARRVWTLERIIGDPDDPGALADRVTALSFSPDGKLLATGGGVPSRDGELKLWRVADGTLVRQIEKAHSDAINSVTFSPDGELLATAAGDRFARVWRVSDGARVGNLEGHTGHVLSVAWRADGLVLATGGADRSVRLWDAVTFRQTKNTNTFNSEVTAVSFVGPGDLLLAASGDKSLRLGDQPLPEAASYAFCAASDLPGTIAVVGGLDGVLRVWSVADRKLKWTFGSTQTAVVASGSLK